MSSVKGDGGLVLTWKLTRSPARALVREQYPSIHGHRYLVFGSTLVLLKSQSRVPPRSFSRRTRSLEAPRAWRDDEQLETRETALRPRTPLSSSRRAKRREAFAGRGFICAATDWSRLAKGW